MKKFISLVLAALLAASVFVISTGCSDDKGDDTFSSAVSSSFSEAELNVLLESINICDCESVGGTLRVAKTAADIKNWVQLNKPDIKKVTGIAKKYYSDFSEEQKAVFQKNYDAVAYAEKYLWIDLETSVDVLAEKAGAYMQFEYSDCDDELEDAFMNAINFEFDYQKPDSDSNPTIKNDKKSKFDKESYLEFLLDASSIGSGSAGSSYRLELCAANFMQFVVDNSNCTQKEIKAGMKECYSLLSITDRINFDGDFESVMSVIDEFIQNPSEITDLEKSVDMDKFSKSLLYKFVDIMPEISGVYY